MARLSKIPTLNAALTPALLAALLSLAAPGCTARTNLPAGDANSETDNGDTDAPGTTTAGSTGTDPADTTDTTDTADPDASTDDAAEEDTTGEDDPCDSFLGCMDLPCQLPEMCDFWAQDCDEEDQKCTAIIGTPGIDAYDANLCVASGALPPGASCTPIDELGTDTCDAQSLCMFVDPDTGEGTCVEFCTGTPDDPACPISGLPCRKLFGGVLNVCLPDCNPLLPGACAPGLACAPEVTTDGVAGFVCLDDNGGPLSGESCSWGACAAGHMCIDAASFGPGCDGNDCCTEFCDLTDAAFTCAGPDQQCVALFDPADPLYANVGACMVP